MTTIIPFKILYIGEEGVHLMIKIYVNDKAANVIIDTGASNTVFDKKRILKYVTDKKISTYDKLSSGLGTNKMKSHFTTIKKLKIGDLKMVDYKTVLLDLSHVNKSYRQVGLAKVEGVLGSDILLKYKALIDYENKILKLKYKKLKK
jgi:hypothetical protein